MRPFFMLPHRRHLHHDGHDHAHAGASPRMPQGPIDPAQQSMADALRSGFNVLRVIMVLLVVLYFLSGWFTVGPGEQGVIVRFGKLRANAAGSGFVYPQGTHFALPDPFDQKIRLTGETLSMTIDTFVYKRRPEDRGKALAELTVGPDRLNPGTDGAMLSGDRNLSHGLWTVKYRIKNGGEYVEHVGEASTAILPILQRVAEAAVIETVASRRVEDVTRQGISAVQEEVRQRVVERLEQLRVGVEVTAVIAETIEPSAVRDSFREVLNAQNESTRLINEARQERERILNGAAGPQYAEMLQAIAAFGAAQAASADAARLRELQAQIDATLERAGGQVAVELGRARAKANEVRETMRSQHEQYTKLLDAYRRVPAATLMDLWTQARSSVTGSKQNSLMFVPKTAETIEILFNRDPEEATRAELERVKGQPQ